MVVDPEGAKAHDRLGDEWRFAPENPDFRDKVLETDPAGQGSPIHRYVPRRQIPECAAWFETAWAAYRKGEVYR